MLKFEEYLYERDLTKYKRELILSIFSQMQETKHMLEEASFLVESGVFDGDIESLNENSIADKIRNSYKNAMEILKDKGKKALTASQETLIKIGGKISSVVSFLISKIKEWVTNSWNKAKEFYKSVFQEKRADLSAKLKEVSKEKITALREESKHSKDDSLAISKWVLSGFPSAASNSIEKAVEVDIKESFEINILKSINEAVKSGAIDFTEIIMERIDSEVSPAGENKSVPLPYLKKITNILRGMPPFSLLEHSEEAIEKGARNVLEKLSIYASKFSSTAGPYKYVLLPPIIAFVLQETLENLAENSAMSFLPGIGQIIFIITTSAGILSCIDFVYENLV